jgi:hypothetical protein
MKKNARRRAFRRVSARARVRRDEVASVRRRRVGWLFASELLGSRALKLTCARPPLVGLLFASELFG